MQQDGKFNSNKVELRNRVIAIRSASHTSKPKIQTIHSINQIKSNRIIVKNNIPITVKC